MQTESSDLASFDPYSFVSYEHERDQSSVIALIGACYGGYGQKLELETLDDDLLRIPSVYPPGPNTFRVLRAGERVVGTVAVKARSETEAELKRVFLDPDLRGRGTGKQLVLWAVDWARTRGYNVLHIWSDALYDTAHRLYRRIGAVETGEQRHLGGINNVDELYFRLDLSR